MIWIDALKGLTILLVALHHAHLSLLLLSDMPPLFDTAIEMTRYIRMPTFFFCSGLLFGAIITRPWRLILAKRIFFAVWIIGLWTLIYYASERAGLWLYPWESPERVALNELYWTPYGVLWFMYAIAVAVLLARLIHPLPIWAQFIVALLVIDGIGILIEVLEPTGMHRHFLQELKSRAIPFFLFGVWLRGPILHHFATLPQTLRVLAVVAPVCLALLALNGLGTIDLSRPVLTLLATTLFVPLMRVVFSLPPLARPFAAIGRISLHIFLLHMFLVGAMFQLWRSGYWPQGLPVPFELAMYLGATLGTILLAQALIALLPPLAFRAPALPWQARRQSNS